MYSYTFIFTFLTLFISRCKSAEDGNKFSVVQIHNIRDNKTFLPHINVSFIEFNTGKQEFGCFRGYFEKVSIDGLDTFEITEFKFSIKSFGLNVTVLLPKLNFTGGYNLDGALNFPMANKPVHVFGNGDMRIVIANVSTSIKLTLKSKRAIVTVDKLNLSLNINSMNIKLCNMMGGWVLENIFNEYFSLLGPTVFDYYKNDIIQQLKDPLIQEINKFLKEFLSNPKSAMPEKFLSFKNSENLFF